MNANRNKILTIHTMNILGEGSYSFTGELHGFQVVFDQYDNGPIEFNREAFAESIGNSAFMWPQKYLDFIVLIAKPEIERMKYYNKLITTFSEN